MSKIGQWWQSKKKKRDLTPHRQMDGGGPERLSSSVKTSVCAVWMLCFSGMTAEIADLKHNIIIIIIIIRSGRKTNWNVEVLWLTSTKWLRLKEKHPSVEHVDWSRLIGPSRFHPFVISDRPWNPDCSIQSSQSASRQALPLLLTPFTASSSSVSPCYF